jgi:TP901 family phage tail tape measure protein
MGQFSTSWSITLRDNVAQAANSAAKSYQEMVRGQQQVQQGLNKMGESGAKSLAQLQRELKGLRNSFRQSTDPQQQQQLAKAIQGTTAQIQAMNAQLRATPTTHFGKLKAGISDLAQSIPGASLLVNPFVAAGVGIGVATRSAMKFEDQLADLSAIAGIQGEGLTKLGDVARKQSLEFGVDAAQNVESFKLILSQLGPDLANSSEAMDILARNVNTLSKASGLDAVQSTNALTTAVNQFGVSFADPIAGAKEMTRIMNVMAAGAKEGSAEVPDLSESLVKSGAVAKSTGVSFEELVAGLETLSLRAIKGADAGTAMRNFLAIIASNTGPAADKMREMGLNVGQLTNTTLPLAQRLKALSPIMNDTSKMVEVFGRENFVAAQAIVQQQDTLVAFTQKVSGTNTAFEQASVKMATFSEMVARGRAWLQEIALTIGNAVLPALKWMGENFDLLKIPLTVIASLIAGNLITSFVRWIGLMPLFSAGIGGVRLSLMGLGAAMKAVMLSNPLGWIITGVGLIIQFKDEILGAADAFLEFLGLSSTAANIQMSAEQMKSYVSGAEAALKSPEGQAMAKAQPIAAFQQGGTGAAAFNAPTATARQELGSTFTAGARESRNVIVNIDKLVENLNINTSTLNQGTAATQEQVKRVLLDAVRDAETTL